MIVHHVARPGALLALHDTGGAGPVVAFQHGLTADAAQIAESFPDDPRWRRLTLECRGHGQSSPEGPFSIAQFADDLASVIQTLPGPAILGGISMGAAIALRLAVIRPKLVRALCLVRPAWADAPAPENLGPNAEVGSLLAAMPAEAARAAFLQSPTAERLRLGSPDNLASLLGMFAGKPQQVTAALLAAISADGPGVTASEIAALRVPAMICGAAEDMIHPAAMAEALARAIPGAQYRLLPPKAPDKSAHIRALHTALSGFLTEL